MLKVTMITGTSSSIDKPKALGRVRKGATIATVMFIITLSACQLFNPVQTGQKATQDVGEEPPTLLSSPTPSAPTPLPTIQKKPADSDSPAAGICASSSENPVPITIVPGNMPDPRCMKVTSGQRLQIKNGTGEVVRIQLGLLDLTLQAGETRVFDTPCGDFLEPGVHWAILSAGSVPEIWLTGN